MRWSLPAMILMCVLPHLKTDRRAGAEALGGVSGRIVSGGDGDAEDSSTSRRAASRPHRTRALRAVVAAVEDRAHEAQARSQTWPPPRARRDVGGRTRADERRRVVEAYTGVRVGIRADSHRSDGRECTQPGVVRANGASSNACPRLARERPSISRNGGLTGQSTACRLPTRGAARPSRCRCRCQLRPPT